VFGDDDSRLMELRRRVQADPASMAFAQLAEECRRGGSNEEAVGICRAGLQFHPDYLSARVTLGRALTELGQLDEAKTELAIVLASAPDNLAANRAMAEIYQQRGELADALTYYKKALSLAYHDPDLENAVERIEHVVAPPRPQPAPSPVKVEDLFDFDTLLAQLGGRTQPRPDIPEPIDLAAVVQPLVNSVLDAVPLSASDPLAQLEQRLRDTDEQPYQRPADFEENQRQQRVMASLEEWLMAIVSDRDEGQARA
jgi:tetratricopeptide (TPR) repeat protein